MQGAADGGCRVSPNTGSNRLSLLPSKRSPTSASFDVGDLNDRRQDA
ncbi:hypothetical protein [Brachybacterium sacelli]